MIFKIFVFFVLEILISLFIIREIVKLDTKIVKFNNDLENSKDSIAEIAVLSKKISVLSVEYAEDIKDRIEEIKDNFLIQNFVKIVKIILIFKLNKIVVKKFLSPKVYKNLKRSLKLIRIMI